MGERSRILNLAERAYRTGAWHGPALLESLDGLTASLAAKRPSRAAHSIWGLVEHVTSWNEIVARRLQGESPEVTPEFDFPRTPAPTAAAWKATLRRLDRSHGRFRAAVAAFPEGRLGRRRPKLDQTWSVLIHGQIQHMVWHAGQIAVLRRSLGRPLAG